MLIKIVNVIFRFGGSITSIGFLSMLLVASAFAHAVNPESNRVIVLTDIEADPDDTQSLVRLFLYSNLIDIQGLIATTSVHQKHAIAPESIRSVIRAYGMVRKNLAKHEANFPQEKVLMSMVKSGQPTYGMSGIGDNKDTEGSNWIIQQLEANDDRPLWISVWGGANTLAQALYTLNERRTETELQNLIKKLRVYAISDQDDTGVWIRKNFPDLFYIVSPGGYGAATWTGMSQVVDGIDNASISNRWLADNIQQAHGPLGSIYPDVAYGLEGDTPAWLSLIPNGLNSPENPNWGGWGGRYELYIPKISDMDPNGFNGGIAVLPEPRAIWTNAKDNYTPVIDNEYGRTIRKSEKSFNDYRTTIWRWRDEVQNDFAARMDWTTKDFGDANHPPIVQLAHPESIKVKSGQYFSLNASGSSDPDDDSLSFFWFPYPEAGTYHGEVNINAANLKKISMQAPKVDKEETLHFIVRVTDKGSPKLSRYKRVVVTINP